MTFMACSVAQETLQHRFQDRREKLLAEEQDWLKQAKLALQHLLSVAEI